MNFNVLGGAAYGGRRLGGGAAFGGGVYNDPAATASLASILNYDANYFWWYANKYGRPPTHLPQVPANSFERLRHQPYRQQRQQQRQMQQQPHNAYMMPPQQHLGPQPRMQQNSLLAPNPMIMPRQGGNLAGINNNPPAIPLAANVQNQANGPPPAPKNGAANLQNVNSAKVQETAQINVQRPQAHARQQQVYQISINLQPLHPRQNQPPLQRNNIIQLQIAPTQSQRAAAFNQANPPLPNQKPTTYHVTIPPLGQLRAQQQPNTKNIN